MLRAAETLEAFDFPPGYPTTVGTVKKLAELARKRHTDPRIRARVQQITAHLPSLDVDGEIRAVWDFVLAHVRYIRDPLGAEYITDPLELDRQVDEGVAAEDCETMALYAATLLAAAGIPSMFEIQGRDPSRPQSFSHCALWVINPRTGRGISFDPVGALEVPGFELGDSLHRPGNPIERWSLEGTKMITVRDQLLGCCYSTDSMMGAAFGDVESTARDIADAVKGIAPAAGPYGAIAAGLIQIGEEIYDKATGKPVGMAVAVLPPPPAGAAKTKALLAKGRAGVKAALAAQSSSSSGTLVKAAGAGAIVYGLARLFAA